MAGAQSVSEEELKSIGDRTGDIIFENYVGPVTEFSTREEILGIGSFLASSKDSNNTWGNKYQIIRSFQPEITEGLDADILVILPDAGVDNIRNLRLILSAYLTGTFSYKEHDADVLAEFITYYNAVYYKNLNHFSSKYKPGVLKYLSADDAGLSTHFSEWAGKSRIVIPLKSSNGIVQSSVDTSSISAPDVVKEMQKEQDKALDTRRDMVDIREKELDQKQQTLDQKQQENTKKEEKLQEQLVQKKEELAASEPDSTQSDSLKKEISNIEEEKKQVVDEKKTIQEQQKEIDTGQKEVAQMREDIAKDENIMKQDEPKKPGIVVSSNEQKSPEGFWFIYINKEGDPVSYGNLLKVTQKGEILQKSELNSIRGKDFTETAKGIVVIAGKNEERTRVKALLLNRDSLQVIKESETDIYPGSSIWTEGSNLFMISRNDQNWSVCKYSENLDLLLQSPVNVNPDTSLLFIGDTIVVQSTTGEILSLSSKSLSKVE